jgi:hypothetical protein
LLGSPQYMAPEQIRSAHTVDARADIWSLGVLLFRILTGRQAFACETPAQTFAAVLMDAPPRLRDVQPEAPEGLSDVLAGCMERDLAKRISSADELAARLTPFAAPWLAAGPWSNDDVRKIARRRTSASRSSGSQSGSVEASLLSAPAPHQPSGPPPSYSPSPSFPNVAAVGPAPSGEATITLDSLDPIDEATTQAPPSAKGQAPAADFASHARQGPIHEAFAQQEPSLSYVAQVDAERRKRRLALSIIGLGVFALAGLGWKLATMSSDPSTTAPRPTSSASNPAPFAPPSAGGGTSTAEPRASVVAPASSSITSASAAPSTSDAVGSSAVVTPSAAQPAPSLRPPGARPGQGLPTRGDPFADRL